MKRQHDHHGWSEWLATRPRNQLIGSKQPRQLAARQHNSYEFHTLSEIQRQETWVPARIAETDDSAFSGKHIHTHIPRSCEHELRRCNHQIRKYVCLLWIPKHGDLTFNFDMIGSATSATITSFLLRHQSRALRSRSVIPKICVVILS